MEKFPKLTNTQVALLRADINTGHVIDEKLGLAISDDQKVYTLFDDSEKALFYAKNLILENKTVECVIYSDESKILYHLDYAGSLI